MESCDAEEKLRLMCSHGGRFLPRDRGGERLLRYVGGETRVVSFPRRSSLCYLLLKLSRLLSPPSPFCLKYQLPSQEILHALSTPDDLRHMLLHHDRLLSLPTPSRLRLFLLPPEPPPLLDSLLDLGAEGEVEEGRVAPDSPVVDAEPSSSRSRASSPAPSPAIHVELLPSTAADSVNCTANSSSPAVSPTEAHPFRESLLERSLDFQESKYRWEIWQDSGGNKVESQVLRLPEQILKQQAHQSPQVGWNPSMPLQGLYPMHNHTHMQQFRPPNSDPSRTQIPSMIFAPVRPNGAYTIPIPLDIIATHVPPSSAVTSSQGIASPAIKPESHFTVAQFPPIPRFLLHRSGHGHRPYVGSHPATHLSSQSTLAIPTNSRR